MVINTESTSTLKGLPKLADKKETPLGVIVNYVSCPMAIAMGYERLTTSWFKKVI